MIVRTTSLPELYAFTDAYLKRLVPSVDGATLILLSGDLGSGKTAFAKAVGGVLHVFEEMTSPTFVIAKRYTTDGAQFRSLLHIDAYRLESGDELARLKWAEWLKEEKTLILLEWPERVISVLPKEAKRLQFRFINETTREIEETKEN